MPNKVVFKNFNMSILEQEFQQIKGACYNVEAYEFPRVLNMYLMGLK